MKNLEWAIKLIRDLAKRFYTGKVEINFYLGGITNINKVESVKPEE